LIIFIADLSSFINPPKILNVDMWSQQWRELLYRPFPLSFLLMTNWPEKNKPIRYRQTVPSDSEILKTGIDA